MSPAASRCSEAMLVRQNNNATYTATWTPACTGVYHINLIIDGYSVNQVIPCCFITVTLSLSLINTTFGILFSELSLSSFLRLCVGWRSRRKNDQLLQRALHFRALIVGIAMISKLVSFRSLLFWKAK